MNETSCDKLVFAVLQGDDYGEVVYALNQEGIAVTMLNSTGGFLKKRSVTVMIGVAHDRLDTVLDVLKRTAGRRVETVYQGVPAMGSCEIDPLIAAAPVKVQCGGIVAFILDLDRMERF